MLKYYLQRNFVFGNIKWQWSLCKQPHGCQSVHGKKAGPGSDRINKTTKELRYSSLNRTHAQTGE